MFVPFTLQKIKITFKCEEISIAKENGTRLSAAITKLLWTRFESGLTWYSWQALQSYSKRWLHSLPPSNEVFSNNLFSFLPFNPSIRHWWMWSIVLRPRVQHTSDQSNVAVSLQVPVVLQCSMWHLFRAHWGIYMQMSWQDLSLHVNW